MTLAEDIKTQRVSLTDDGSGGEQEEASSMINDRDKPSRTLRDSTRPCLFVAALLMGFATLALIMIGVVAAAFGQSSGGGEGNSSAVESAAEASRSLYPAAAAEGRYIWRGSSAEGGTTWRVRWYDGNDGGQPLSWKGALAALRAGELDAMTQALRASPHASSAFFWELPPVSLSSAASTPFEMVTVAATGLAAAGADAGPFSRQLGPCAGTLSIQSFPNLGGDATLVAPCAAAGVPSDVYSSLASFVRGAPAEQAAKLWREVGAALSVTLRRRGAEPTWVSTEGSGVSWLHVRMDSRPKYYHHSPYTRWPAPSSGVGAVDGGELK